MDRIEEIRKDISELKALGLIEKEIDFRKELESAHGIVMRQQIEISRLKKQLEEKLQIITDMEEDARRFPTMAEFSNLSDDYELCQKQLEEKEVENARLEQLYNDAGMEMNILRGEKEKAEAELSEARARLKPIEKVLKKAYCKHHLNDDSIGWDELGEALLHALCELMGDEDFNRWLEDERRKQ